ncbi:hypothetical protein H0H87_011239 [Tephrocybe sp. NHM501043]|nr:hypothetical protein H0H87_011239 [Tephrocybe sp. NHM501043]
MDVLELLYTPKGLATVLLLLILLVQLFIRVGRSQSKLRGNALLLVGPPDAGKTAILSAVCPLLLLPTASTDPPQLVHGTALPTHTSLQANSSALELSAPKKPIRVVDIPGHPRIRDQFRDHLPDAKAIAFVVDASTVSRNAPAVAEHLHNILQTLPSLPPSQTLPSLLILAHKSDLLNTRSQAHAAPADLAINRVRSVLERELEKRRASQSGGVGVDGLGAEGEKPEIGGLDTTGPAGGAFKFADWEGGDISFLGTSTKGEKPSEDSEKSGEYGLASLQEWLDENM